MKPTQTSTMLFELRRAGREGVHSFTFARDFFMRNPSARVQDLEDMGHEIDAQPERLHGTAVGVRYRLTKDAGGTGSKSGDERVAAFHSVPNVESEPVEGELGPQLFPVPGPYTRPSGAYEDAA